MLLLLVGVGLTVLNYLYGILTRYSAITAYIDKKKGIIRIVEKFPTPAFRERETMANLLGFKYVISQDSTISTPRFSGIRWYNKSMTLELEQMYGKNIIKKWVRASDSLFRENSHEKMKAAVLKIPEVQQFEKYLDSATNGKEKPFVIVFVDVIEGNAHVGRMNRDSSVSIFYNYTIDPYTLQSEKIQY